MEHMYKQKKFYANGHSTGWLQRFGARRRGETLLYYVGLNNVDDNDVQ